MKANIQASLKRWMVSALKFPVQNLMSMSLKAERSVDGSDVIAFFNISYDQLVGPDRILFGAFVIAEYMALSDGM